MRGPDKQTTMQGRERSTPTQKRTGTRKKNKATTPQKSVREKTS